MTFIAEFLSEAKKIIEQLDGDAVERMVELVKSTRSRGGRLFILGLGEVRATRLMLSTIFAK